MSCDIDGNNDQDGAKHLFDFSCQSCNPKPNQVCFKVAFFKFEIANIMSELNESTKRVYVSDLFLDNNNVS